MTERSRKPVTRRAAPQPPAAPLRPRSADPLRRRILRALAPGEGGAPQPEAAALLTQAGFRHGDDAARHLQALTSAMKPRGASLLMRAILAALPNCPDPGLALTGLLRFAEARFGPDAVARIAALPQPVLDLLIRLFGTSPFLTGLLVCYPQHLDWLAADPELGLPRTVKACQAVLEESVRGIAGLEPRRLATIRAMRRELLRLSVRRIMNLSDEMEMARELSDLAQATLQVALNEVLPPLAARFGWPMEEMAAETLAPERRAGFAVIGMGKLGGRELNFSSDIDLLFIYSDEGLTTGLPDGTGRITNHVFFSRLAESLTDYVMSPSDEGSFYRVDTRLRPDGETGPLARSLSSYEIYYTTQARLWERLALLKARAVAGDLRLGHAFESMSRPLVFDPLHSHELVHQIADLKQRIDHEIGRRAGADREVKRGAGGIREIEFLVQTLQMLHGAHNTRLWTAETPEAIRQLTVARILEPEQARRMLEDYLFLRTLEHRLQMAHLRQTHMLPEQPEALDALALACGLREEEGERTKDEGQRTNAKCGMRNAELRTKDEGQRTNAESSAGVSPAPSAGPLPDSPLTPGQRLMARWGEISQRVHRDFTDFFERSTRAAQAESEGLGAESSTGSTSSTLSTTSTPPPADPAREAAALILSSAPEGAILPQLAPWGIASGGALKVLRRLGGMGRTMYLTTEGRLAYQRLLPEILRLLESNPRPEAALSGLESFLYASGAIAGFYTTFLQNMPVFELLMLAFGSGDALAQTLTAHPEFLDTIADARLLSSRGDRRGVMKALLGQWLREERDLPRFCRMLAKLKRLEFLLAALGELAGMLDYPASCERMSTMAALIIEEALARAAEEVAPGWTSEGYAVLALGKLGADELNYYSDLDLIFVWDETFAPGAASPGEAATALSHRVIELLTHPTPEGAPFNVDMRLRPEGQNAPLAPPLVRYAEYYASERAQVWEFQSVMKMRPIAGDLALGRRLAARLGEIIAGRVRGLRFAGEIKAMRRRMEAALKTPRWVAADFKSGPGGTVDLEFIAQFLQLKHLAEDPGLMGLGPLKAFDRLARAGLLARDAADALIADYVWMRRVERRTRLLLESEKSMLPASGEKLTALERACAPLAAEQGEPSLLEAMAKVMRRNRKHFDELIGD